MPVARSAPPPLPRLASALGLSLIATLAPVAAADAAGPLPTLDGAAPLVISHRGLPGLAPEETLASYELAARLGTDALEMDLHLTRDCVLVARHNPWMGDNTNVAEVAKASPEVAARRRTVPGVMAKVAWAPTPGSGPSEYLTDLTDPGDPRSVLRSLVVDGEDHAGDWSVSDFTMDELRRWFGGTTYDAAAERPKALNGRVPLASFQEIIDLAKAESARTGRTIAVYPEAKNPTWNNAQAVANGCGAPGSRPFEDAILEIVRENGLNAKDAPILVQSFEPSSLRYMVAHGLKTRVVQLVGADGLDLRTGAVTYDDVTISRPYDWTVAGDPRWFAAMLTPAGLAEIRTYADGIGPWKPQIVPLKVEPYPERNADGSPFKPTTPQARALPATSLVADAHEAGLFVHVYTFRDEARYLAGEYGGDPRREYAKFFALGVDGVFTDFTLTAAAVRDAFVRQAARAAAARDD